MVPGVMVEEKDAKKLQALINDSKDCFAITMHDFSQRIGRSIEECRDHFMEFYDLVSVQDVIEEKEKLTPGTIVLLEPVGELLKPITIRPQDDGPAAIDYADAQEMTISIYRLKPEFVDAWIMGTAMDPENLSEEGLMYLLKQSKMIH